MKFKLEIDMDNAAFNEPDDELARILRNLADTVEQSIPAWGWSASVRDVNGNTVGKASIGTPAHDRVRSALAALLDWGRSHTSPRDENSPHELLIEAAAALNEGK